MSDLAEIALESGTWVGIVVRLASLPEDETVGYFLTLYHPGREDSQMDFRLSSDPREMSQSELSLRCKHPRARRVKSDGALWTFYPTRRPGLAMGVSADFEGVPYRVVFSSDTELHGAADLPMGSALGDLADEDLLELARNHAH